VPRPKQPAIIDVEGWTSEGPCRSSVVGKRSDDECRHDIDIDRFVRGARADERADPLVPGIDDAYANDVANVGEAMPVLLENAEQRFRLVQLVEEPSAQCHESVKRLGLCRRVDRKQSPLDPFQIRSDCRLQELFLRREVSIERAASRLKSDRRLDVADGGLPEPALGEEADTGSQ
jgi:hypothetical protein